MLDLGGAEPIRIEVSRTVFEIFEVKRRRREIFWLFDRSFAVIGQKSNRSSGFCLCRSCASDEPPTSRV